MPKVHFTKQLARFLPVPTMVVDGSTLAEVFVAVFDQHPQLKSYILDDQDAVRQHVAVFVDGIQLASRTRLDEHIEADSEIYVFQALSGGLG